jgi:hypothetical protein
MAHKVITTDEGWKILELLGISTTGIVKADIHFRLDDVVRIDCEYLIFKPEGQPALELKNYVLSEIAAK